MSASHAPDTKHTALLQRCHGQFVGLAPLLRLSIAGEDLRPLAQALLAAAGSEDDNAPLWLNLATVMFAIGQRDVALSIQAQALQMSRDYLLPARRQPATQRLLVLAVPGDIAENTPIDCLLEDSAVDLQYSFPTPERLLPPGWEQSDAILVAISDSTQNRPLLALLGMTLGRCGKTVINAPRHIQNTERSRASELLQGIPGLHIPLTRQATRSTLQDVAEGRHALAETFPDCPFPIIVRPVGSQGGRDLSRVDTPAELAAYLLKTADPAFYLARFIDYSGPDGLFRKYRIALIAGRPFACHMGISAHWMIHYVNAGMYDDAAKRAEEAHFMTSFDAFAARHATALSAIAERSQLDYACIDCAETRTGELLVFELDHTMVVHAMDTEALFPHKKVQIDKVRQAFELLIAPPTSSHP